MMLTLFLLFSGCTQYETLIEETTPIEIEDTKTNNNNTDTEDGVVIDIEIDTSFKEYHYEIIIPVNKGE